VKNITPFVLFTSISHSLCLVPLLSVVCWRAHVLFTLIVCVCVHSGVQHTLCCVFFFVLFRIVYPKLSASLDCHFWIALSSHIKNNITSTYICKYNLCSIHGLHNINARYNNINFVNFQCVFA
jgi:hypothetical protein